MIAQIYTLNKNYRTVHFKWVIFMEGKLYLNRAVERERNETEERSDRK